MEPIQRRAPWSALVAVTLIIATACQEPTVAPAPPPEPLGFEITPILWATSEVPFQDFRLGPVRTLHEELATVFGEPLLFRIVPFVERSGEPPRASLRGETLEIYYQESKASVPAVRRKVDQAVRSVRTAFPGLDLHDHLLIHARLPEGKTVTDLDRKVAKECGARNVIRTDVRPFVYVPGRLEELTFVLCDGPAVLDARLQDPEWPLIPENWSPDDRSR
jgi:hypothetical protein